MKRTSPARERPAEREVDLLEPLVGRPAAESLLERYPLHQLITLDEATLLAVPRVGPRRARAIRRLPQIIQSLARPGREAAPLTSSRDVFELYRFRLGLLERELFMVLALNSRNRIVEEEMIAAGTVNTVHVRPADILRPAVRMGAAGIICLHNHPSGDPSPSPEDRALTDRIRQAAQLMGVRFLDHLVVCLGSYHSFSDSGEW